LIIQDIIAPISGKVFRIIDVPDRIFASRIVGDGVAIDPTEGMVVAPFDGVVRLIHSMNHLVGMRSKEGLDIIIHVGVDTIGMGGEGFERVVSPGSFVELGQPILRFDLGLVRLRAKSTLSPLVVTNGVVVQDMFGALVRAGKDVVMRVKMADGKAGRDPYAARRVEEGG